MARMPGQFAGNCAWIFHANKRRKRCVSTNGLTHLAIQLQVAVSGQPEIRNLTHLHLNCCVNDRPASSMTCRRFWPARATGKLETEWQRCADELRPAVQGRPIWASTPTDGLDALQVMTWKNLGPTSDGGTQPSAERHPLIRRATWFG